MSSFIHYLNKIGLQGVWAWICVCAKWPSLPAGRHRRHMDHSERQRGHERAGCPAPTENRLRAVSTWIKLFLPPDSLLAFALGWSRVCAELSKTSCMLIKAPRLNLKRRVFVCRYAVRYASGNIVGKPWSMCRENILASSAYLFRRKCSEYTMCWALHAKFVKVCASTCLNLWLLSLSIAWNGMSVSFSLSLCIEPTLKSPSTSNIMQLYWLLHITVIV